MAGFLTNIFSILSLYRTDKISVSFKDMFLSIFKKCISVNDPININLITDHFKDQLKKEFLKVRDIRWLLLEMEKYSQIFQFTEDDLLLMKESGASRDNIYLVKKFLKKDGDYEEMYNEEEGGGIKFQYHMTGGHLNGEYKEYYKNGTKKAIRNYKDGELDGITETWYKNGKRSVYASFKKGLMHGVYNSWYENENPMYESQHQNNIRQGTRIDYYYNGQKTMIRNYIDGIQVGEYKYWAEGGALLKDIIYDNKGKLTKLKHYHSSGILDLEKTLIENDTYELSRYYESTGKLHYKVMMRDDKWNGEYISYWDSGKVCTKTTYKNHKLDGEWEYWNEDGTLKEKIVYKNGEKQV
jgi:antitoxin component YwqK of YwqJK toxin-antitoxin module